MSLLVVGSIAMDSVETPTETRNDVLGGAAVYFSYAASYFTHTKLVGVVGDDWPAEHTEMLQSRNVCTDGLEVVEGGKTFRWRGKYHTNMNDRDTLEVHLNVFGDFNPKLPEGYQETPFVFLANGAPTTQLCVLEQVKNPKLVVADTMDLWIETQTDELKELMSKIDGIVMNDSEAKILCDTDNMVRAGKAILEMGPKFAIIKKGEHGAMFFSKDEIFVLPAYPTEKVQDPTGAGDSFAGGMMGYLASVGEVNSKELKRALVYGTLVASYNVEDFSLDQMQRIERKELDERFAEFKAMFEL